MTRTPIDMVFSETSLKTRNLLKVVEINRLKPNKNQQANGLTGVISDENSETTPSSPAPTTSFSEVRKKAAAEYLKPEPLFDTEMFPEPDYEFFQDLGWSSAPVRDEQALTTDFTMKKTEERANTYDTTNTPFSPQGWNANSPLAQASFYGTSTPKNSLSPSAVDGFSKFDDFLYPQELVNNSKIESPELFQNLQDLPVVVLGDENYGCDNIWPVANSVDWPYTTYTTQHSKHPHTIQTKPFIYQEDSLNQDDLKYTQVMPRDVENNNVVISEFLIDHQGNGGVLEDTGIKPHPMLSVDLMAAGTSNGHNISTPDVVNYVVQLEKEKSPNLDVRPKLWPPEETAGIFRDTSSMKTSPIDHMPSTPKNECQVDSDSDYLSSHATRQSRRKRHRTDSDDSDETYTPPSKKGEKKKIRSNIKEIKEMINLQKPPRRGRPPKDRRESTFSSVGSVDDNASNISSEELRYRNLRDKNNEASKRSRMNRKLKELQMEQLADELEEQNKKLKVKANILEEMTLKLKNALMVAMTQK